MKVNFTSNNQKRYKIYGIYKYSAIPVKLTDAQVEEVNQKRILPEDLFVKTNQAYSTAFYGPRDKAAIKILKYEDKGKDHPAANAKIFKTLPDGYKLENYKNKTYIAFNEINIAKEKKKFKLMTAGFITAYLGIIGAIAYRMVRKK